MPPASSRRLPLCLMLANPLALSFAALAFALSAHGGALEWSPSHLSARLAPGQEEIELAFEARNTSTGPVAIETVDSSCGCTTADIEPRIIAAGATARLRAVYRAGGRAGTVHRTIRVKSAAGEDTLSFAIEHPVWFFLERASLVWTPTAPRTEQAARLELAAGVHARLGEPRVAKAGTFSARLAPVADASDRYLLHVAPLAPSGPLFSPIVVPVEFPDGRTATITLQAALR